MSDPKLWWAVLVFGLGMAGQAAIVWWRTGEHSRRIQDLEAWRLAFVERFSHLLGRLGEND